MKSVLMRAAARLLQGGLVMAALTGTAVAEDGLSGSGNAWIMTATALVLFMTLPGLALFYAGLVRARNSLSVLMHCFAIACLCSVLWFAAGYTIAFGDVGSGFIGSLDKLFLKGITPDSLSGSLPEITFVMFQMTFAIITPALIVGAYVERIRFSAMLVFSGLWMLVVYAPVVHWIWGGGFMSGDGWFGQTFGTGVMDFAGGIVVHATAGATAIVAAVMLGKRRGWPEHSVPPHAPWMTMIGAAMLWVGWFGFNGGSQLASDGGAGMAIAVTHLSAATASLVWAGIEWKKFGKPTLIGIVTGMVGGLATVTPASGFIGPMGGIICGLLGGSVCFYAVLMMKNRLKIDDSLDVFAVHGVGGIMGSLMVAFLALDAFGGPGLAEGVSAGSQLMAQAVSIVITVIWSVGLSWILLKICDLVFGLRVSEDDEVEGLDITEHGERAYDVVS